MNKLTIIAEVAQGYEGNPGLATSLIRAAASAGADAAKFQLVYADELATPDYKHYKLFKSLEMADTEWEKLGEFAANRKIDLYLDVFGERSLSLSEKLSVKAVKVHSTDMANIGLLKMVADSSIPRILLSTGGCYSGEIKEALSIMGNKEVVLLHGFQGYPTPTEANQVARLAHFYREYTGGGTSRNVKLGFADHVPTDEELRFVLPALAIGIGAQYLEKHLTLAKTMKLEDFEAALDPDEFARFVNDMRKCHSAIGKVNPTRDDFGMSPSELGYRDMTHKHVIAKQAIKRGTVISPELVTLKRTPSQNAIHDLRKAYGKRLQCSVAENTAITGSMLGESE